MYENTIKTFLEPFPSAEFLIGLNLISLAVKSNKLIYNLNPSSPPTALHDFIGSCLLSLYYLCCSNTNFRVQDGSSDTQEGKKGRGGRVNSLY